MLKITKVIRNNDDEAMVVIYFSYLVVPPAKWPIHDPFDILPTKNKITQEKCLDFDSTSAAIFS